VGSLGAIPVPLTCDVPLSRVREARPGRIILSPGPGTPEESGVCSEVIAEFAGSVPILGVCLGHQTIVHAFGGRVSRMREPVHGKVSSVVHSGKRVFSGLPSPFTATRYHSLEVRGSNVPGEFETLAHSEQDGCVMGIAHREMAVTGVQFHPESIMTTAGRLLMANFLATGGA